MFFDLTINNQNKWWLEGEGKLPSTLNIEKEFMISEWNRIGICIITQEILNK